MQATKYMLYKSQYALSTDTGKNICVVFEVVDFNVDFYLYYLNSLLLTICIKQTPSFETNMILNHLYIQKF